MMIYKITRGFIQFNRYGHDFLLTKLIIGKGIRSRSARLNKFPHNFYFDSITSRRSLSTDKDQSNDSVAAMAWNTRYEELIQYIEKEGNSLVPREYKENLPLGRWVDKQRCHYKSNYISEERIQKLNEISFVWEPQEVLWSERYDELLEYIKEHGNSLVPQEYEDNTSLGYWVQKQRTLYKTNSLSDERIQKLNEVGFVWSVLDAQWLERLQELKKYRSDHGDTLVPRSHPLGDWVWWQRLAYKSFIAKKKLGDNHQNNSDMSEVERITNISSGMNEERIQLLEAEDFIWDPKEFAWQLKFEELSEWIAINGHGAIRIRKKNKGPLEMWAARQRKMYKKHLSGEKTTLTKERIEKLQSIGFVFEIGE